MKGPTGVRWHPLFIRWCLNISRVSQKAYDIMRESGIKLPSRRTLSDYTHWMSSRPGFSSEIDNFLLTEAKIDQLEEWQRYAKNCGLHLVMVDIALCRFVVLIIDEMKVKEDLVYDKTGEVLLGFVDLGDINNQLHELELQANSVKPHESIATHMLTLMIRGLFIKLEFPYASFSTQGIQAN